MCDAVALDLNGIEGSTTRVGFEPVWMDAVMRYILDHFADEISLDDLAIAGGVSKFNFCRQFHRFHSLPPLKWLWRFRATLAGELLKLPLQWDIQEVAYSCGFTSCAHFSRVFKDAFGVSPTAFRSRERDATRGIKAGDLTVLSDRDCPVVLSALMKTMALQR